MKQQLAEIEAIAEQIRRAPTFDNTIVAMERSGALLTRAAKVFFNLTQSNTNDTLQKIEAEESPKLAAHSDAIYLNAEAVRAREGALRQARQRSGSTPSRSYLVERYYHDFVRAGAQLIEADKTTLRALNQEESKLTTEVPRAQLLADTNAAARRRRRQEPSSPASATPTSPPRPRRRKTRKLDGKWVLHAAEHDAAAGAGLR